MPRGKGIYDDEQTVEPSEPDPGNDDTTNQQNTPDVEETDAEPTA
jgi:hypothetical protein